MQPSSGASWPELHYADWADTAATLHMWTQIVGKIRLAQTPWTNHSWHVPLYVTASGLTTSPMPYGDRSFQIDFDFVSHRLLIQSTDGRQVEFGLSDFSVAEFYRRIMEALGTLDIQVSIHTVPSEQADGIRFEDDTVHASYDPDAASRFFGALVQIDRVFKQFRSSFIGKCSPVHFFWGSFDHAVTRFSGREAPPHPGGIPNFPDWVAQEAYSHEVSSAGFWPGGPESDAMFYSYAYPEPQGFAEASVPEPAFYSAEMGEFFLPYDAVRTAESPDETLLAFLQSTYEAAANAAGWNRPALERDFSIR